MEKCRPAEILSNKKAYGTCQQIYAAFSQYAFRVDINGSSHDPVFLLVQYHKVHRRIIDRGCHHDRHLHPGRGAVPVPLKKSHGDRLVRP